jgi:surfactin synthase thioesterase subunit
VWLVEVSLKLSIDHENKVTSRIESVHMDDDRVNAAIVGGWWLSINVLLGFSMGKTVMFEFARKVLVKYPPSYAGSDDKT